MTKILESLLDEVGSDESHPIMGLIDIVGDLVDDYEQQLYPLPQTNGVDALRFLMVQHGLKQTELREIGSQGVVSEILTGKRELNLRQVRALSQRFGVSADTFL
jgi:HTH-type transcriptional regulator/antitoxin HigA